MTVFDHLRAQEREVEQDPDRLKKRDDGVGRRFDRFHESHHEVYEGLLALTRKYHSAGRRRGISFFVEVLRHSFFMEGRDDQGFKLNNDFRSRYARLIEERNPDLAGYFRKRRLRARGGTGATL